MEERGFTLVELSIVLVIIGLLIGGILVAQSMIETAKIQSLVREIQQFDVAISNFRQKFKGLPGDSKLMGCHDYGSGNTCDDGVISPDTNGPGYTINQNDYVIGTSFPNVDYSGEVGHFWLDLQNGGFNYNGKTFIAYPGLSAVLDYTSLSPNTPLVRGSIDGGILVMPCGYNSKFNCYEIEQLNGAANVSNFGTFNPIFTPEFALAVDNKSDDGKPFSGTIQNFFCSNGEVSGTPPSTCWSPTNQVGLVTALYNSGRNNATCSLQIQILRDEDGPAQ